MRGLFAVCMLVFLLSGCNATPQVPDVIDVTLPSLATSGGQQLPPVRMEIKDQRTHSHVLRVEHHQDHAEFATTASPLATLISRELSSYWLFSAQSPIKMTLYIEDALIRVEHIDRTYQTNHNISLRLEGEHQNQSILRRYQTIVTGAPLSAPDYNRMQRSFNQGLADTLMQLLNDDELRHWLLQQTTR